MRAILLALPAALVEGRKRYEHAAEIGANGVEDERPAGVAECVRDARRLQGYLIDVLHDIHRAFQ